MQQTRLLTVDGFEIDTVITRAGSSDVVVWMHGISVNKDEYLDFFRDGAQWLASNGVTSIRFDFRGHGKSSGSSLEFSVVAQSLDVRAVMEFAQREFPDARIHLVGTSFGSPPAIFAAARYCDVVSSVSLISPVLSYQRTFLQPETEWARELFSEAQLKALYDTGRLHFDSVFCISSRLVEEMWVIHPDLALRDLQQQVLVIHGDRDSMVPYDAAVKACRGLDHVRLVTLEGADHGFMHEDDEEGTTHQSIANKQTIYGLLEEQISCQQTRHSLPSAKLLSTRRLTSVTGR